MSFLRSVLWLFLITSLSVRSQINPPGLGESNLAGWTAFGIRQSLDTLDKKQFVGYIGTGFKSTPDNSALFQLPGILIINSEFYHQFREFWQYSLALSYRIQYEYEPEYPFEFANPAYRQELRFYSRLSQIFKFNRWKVVGTFRTDFRTFFDPTFSSWNEDFQFRFRIRSQFSYALDSNEKFRLVFSAEPLFAISHFKNSDSWNNFSYRESRLCFFFSYKPKSISFTFDLGYMLNSIPSGQVHYISTDLIWLNPFGKGRFKNKETGTIQM